MDAGQARLCGWGLVIAWSIGSCAPSESKASDAAAAGFLPVTQGDSAQASTSQAPAPAASQAPESAKPAPDEPATAVPKPRAQAGDGAADVPFAAVLLHGSEADLRAFLDARGSGVDEDRKQLAIAFACALSGDRDRAASLADEVDEDGVPAEEWHLLRSALGASQARPVAASFGTAKPVARAMSMRLCEREANAQAAAGAMATAAKLYTSLFLDELAAPWEADRTTLARWTQAVIPIQRAHRWDASGGWASIETTVAKGDSLTSIRKRVLGQHKDLLICTGLIERANQLKNERDLHPGDVLRVPTDRASVLVDVSARWMLYVLGDEVVAAFDIGVGRDGEDTPIGTFIVGPKQKNPMWFRPGQEPVPFGSPDNPLGTRWLPWLKDGRDTHIGFHGTNDEAGVGGRVSQGCVRLRNVDVELLYEILPEGAEVRVQS